MEFSFYKNCFFVAGGDGYNEGFGKISALSFDDQLNIKKIVESEIGNEMTCNITSIRRHPKSDVLFVGGFSTVEILYYESGVFHQLYIIEEEIIDEVMDLRFLNSHLYVLTPAQDYLLEVKFPIKPKILSEKKNEDITETLAQIFTQHEISRMSFKEEIDFMSLSSNGEMLYIGCGDFLRICQIDPKKPGYFLTQEPQETTIDFSDMKELQASYLAYTVSSNHWFELMNMNLQEVARIRVKGWQKMDPRLKNLAFTGSLGHDPFIYIWNMGNRSIGIIDLQRMEYDQVQDIGSAGENESMAHAIISAKNGRKVVSLTTERSSNSYFINYWQKGREKITTQPIEYIKDTSKLSILILISSGC